MKRIAVVEDDIFMREELTEILRRAGYDAESVISFENAARELISFLGGNIMEKKLLNIYLEHISTT